MPKQRQTCTRCSQRRQKCDRKSPCTRCVQNKEAHLCTTEWKEGYNPSVHRRYPKKPPLETSRRTTDQTCSSEDSPDSVFLTSGQLPLPSRVKETEANIESPGDVSSSSRFPTPSSNNGEFTTYDRSEFSNLNMGNLLNDKEEYSRNQTLTDQPLNQIRTKDISNEEGAEGFSPAAQAVEAVHLQSILPSKDQVFQMVDYHQNFMNYWIGGIYHGPSFRNTLLEAYGSADQLDFRNRDWKWCALLFSILSASMIGSSEETSISWGFSNTSKLKLSRQWGNSLITCLQLGNFASRHHIYSVQAILHMHTSEHLVGSAKEWAVYHSASIAIAKGLGLHKLASHPEDAILPSKMTSRQKDALVQREIGRRVWSVLTSQDWLCSISQGVYTLQKRHFTSLPPRHFNEETWDPVQNNQTPTFTSIPNYLNEIAHVLVRYLDDVIDACDIEAKYSIVLKYDSIMRGLAREKMPLWLSTSSPYNSAWPEWVRWARRSYVASSQHKLIMIHQSFLVRSFKDTRYTYSRWTCVNSAKNIIDVLESRFPNEPQWWVEQAFVVTAGLCLGLDLFHHSDKESEAISDYEFILKAITILQQWPTSSVAAHGIRLLTTLLQEHAKKSNHSRPDSRLQNSEFPPNIALQTLADTASADKLTVPHELTEAPIADDLWNNTDFDIDMTGIGELIETLPLQNNGFDNNVFLDSLWNGNGYMI